ncbi:50S ribosomal protein L6 [Candidatus Nitrospira inopinata]|uniref:Large ribosomal subunit protein uL6 n=1 Tax=Candidatus Nitrospira inopinata TaxID=1715989 RepID=A0A0S4KQK0_9BACT|nr:50S ribosomal protein L6 [Candidatus Nitrospira inopinata]MCP9446835.1 50S ribosomal protein L6 [Nitrospira sp.]MCP9472354.1 50S ribosomal protein L6 [Nitrospira sp.]CUQ66721.1 50S ribosomal subunit protein L6 [Candidatus Nitrospira inopinata]
MSRVGRKPIAIPSGVEVKVAGSNVSVKGPLGKLDWSLAPGVAVTVDDGKVQVSRAGEDRKLRALHGLVRAELNNMIHGVTKGYERSLEITGVGYKTQLQGRTMSFNVGYINPVLYDVPAGIDVKVEKQTLITVKGIDKRLVGQVAANLRAIKPPDVYKQKGIRYAGERLRKKEGKTGK